MEFMLVNCDYEVSEIRAVLASMGFSQQDVRKDFIRFKRRRNHEIADLLLLGRYNILLMDEPSNFLISCGGSDRDQGVMEGYKFDRDQGCYGVHVSEL